MDAAEIPLKAPESVTIMDTPPADVEQVERALIDASTRLPVLMFYSSAIAWLLIGTVVAMLVEPILSDGAREQSSLLDVVPASPPSRDHQ